MNAPSMFVPLRGGAVEVCFRERGPHADWWFVAEPGQVSDDELEQIQCVVDAEVRHLQLAWRKRSEGKRERQSGARIVSLRGPGDAA